MIKNNIILVNYDFTKDENKSFFILDDEERLNYFRGLENIEVKDINFLINDGVFSKAQNINFGTIDFYNINKYNYAIIYKTKDEVIDMESVRYYFITSSSQAGGGLYTLVLELDDVMTNYYKYRDKIYGLVVKAHLNRFKEIHFGEDSSYEYNFSENNAFSSQSSEYNINRYLKTSYRLECNESSLDPENPNKMKNWLSKHVKYWVLCFMSQGENIYKLNNTDTVSGYNLIYGIDFNCPYSICYYPVMEDGYNVYVDYEYDNGDVSEFRRLNIDKRGFDTFIGIAGNSPKIYNILYSKDLVFTDDFCFKSFSGNNLILRGSKITHPNKDNIILPANSQGIQLSRGGVFANLGDGNGLFWGLYYKGNHTYINSELNNYLRSITSFTKDYIKQNSNSLSPLLLTSSCLNLKLNSDSNSSYDYDYSLILTDDNFKDLEFKVTSALDSSGIVSFVRLSKRYGIYNNYFEKSQIGLNETSIISVPWANDKYSEYIANNKNYMFTAISNIVGAGTGSMVMPQYKEAVAEGAGSQMANSGAVGLGLLKSGVKAGLTAVNTLVSYDNMKASKDSLFSNSTSFFLKVLKDKNGNFVDLYDAVNYDKLKVLNDVKVNGYLVNKLGYAKDYDNVRKYYNYLSIIVDDIKGNLSNLEKDRLIKKLEDFTFISPEADTNALYENINYEKVFDDE